MFDLKWLEDSKDLIILIKSLILVYIDDFHYRDFTCRSLIIRSLLYDFTEPQDHKILIINRILSNFSASCIWSVYMG